MNYDIINRKKKELGLTNLEIANKAGITLSTLDKITSGINKNPTLDTLQAIADVIGCVLDDFSDKTVVRNALPNDETRLLNAYRKLNPEGKRSAIGIVESMILNPDYTEDTSNAAM